MLQPFHTAADSGMELGADALLYVMAHGHTISVPDRALYFAQRVGVIGIARRDTPEPVVRDVNRALDLIAASLRTRERLDRESSETASATPQTPIAPPADGNDGGYRVRRQPTPRPYSPIAGARVADNVPF
jgi:hypothetical protein